MNNRKELFMKPTLFIVIPCYNEEEVLPTSNSRIKIAKVREYDYTLVCQQINDLIDTARTYDEIETVRKMKKIVPEYKSKTSIYTNLDN